MVTTALAIPLSRYLAWIMDGKYRAPAFLRWMESLCDTGPQNWKQYAVALMLFNLVMFVFGFVVLALPAVASAQSGRQDDGGPDDDLQHHDVPSSRTRTCSTIAGEQHLSYFSQIFFVCWNMFVSASVGFCGLSAIIRGLRGDAHMGNFYRRHVARRRLHVPAGQPDHGRVLLADGVPMTLQPAAKVATLEPGAMGNDDNGQANAAANLPRPRGGHHPHQAPGDQRRRVLRGQLGTPLREPQRLEQFPHRDELLPLPLHPGADVRTDAQADAARLGDLRRHDVAHGLMIGWAMGGTLAAQPGLGPADLVYRRISPAMERTT